MNGLDLIRDAFTRVRQRSELVAVEILWKWAWVGSVTAIAAGSALLFLDSVVLTPAELRGLRSQLPWLIGLTLRRLWEKHVSELLSTAMIVLSSAAVLWWLAASVVRSGIAGALIEERGQARTAYAGFGRSVRQSLPAYLGSHLWSLATTAVTFWLAFEILLRIHVRGTPAEADWTFAFLRAVLAVAALLFFWQMVAWVLGLGRAVASRRGWGFLRSLGLALHLFATRTADVLFVATTMFLFRAMAVTLAGLMGLAVIYTAKLVHTRLVLAGLAAALMMISVPARWLYLVQQAAFLELARQEDEAVGAEPIATG